MNQIHNEASNQEIQPDGKAEQELQSQGEAFKIEQVAASYLPNFFILMQTEY